jgi:UDP-2,3-diacylglucosamine pyrophosphatase LpxH
MSEALDQWGAWRFRSLFLSDLHLGAPGCRAEAILEFLQGHDADTIYLVGDTFDLWDPLFTHWGEAEHRIVALLAARVAAGRRVVCLVGNHDRALIAPSGRNRPEVGGLAAEILPDLVHVAGDGRRYLVLHGDICDARVLRFHIWTRLGSRADSLLRLADKVLRRLRPALAPEARGPLEMLIHGLNDILYRNRRHERRLVALARAMGCDGVICGHFHIAALHDDHGLRYANCGDWTDSCTALAEAPDGTLALIGQGRRADAPVGDRVGEWG